MSNPKSSPSSSLPSPSKTVQSVLGPISLSSLGKTLTHEHISCNFFKYISTAPFEHNVPYHCDNENNKVTLKNRSTLKLFPYSMVYNRTLNDIDAKLNSFNELYLFKESGGKTIIENSSQGSSRDTASLKIISKETGVNIIVGTGFYNFLAQPHDILNKTIEYLQYFMKDELEVGCKNDNTVKAGFIGEIGVTNTASLNVFEKNVICAASNVQETLGCPVSLSSGWNSDSPYEIMRLFLENGGKSNKVAMCYVDRTLSVKEDLLNFAAEFNCYLQFSLFGTENLMCTAWSSYVNNARFEVLSDAQRIKRILQLKKDKYLDRVLISHNIHTKNKLRYFGGHGYSYILTTTKNHMLKKGLTMTDFDTILEENPKSWLTWTK